MGIQVLVNITDEFRLENVIFDQKNDFLAAFLEIAGCVKKLHFHKR